MRAVHTLEQRFRRQLLQLRVHINAVCYRHAAPHSLVSITHKVRTIRAIGTNCSTKNSRCPRDCRRPPCPLEAQDPGMQETLCMKGGLIHGALFLNSFAYTFIERHIATCSIVTLKTDRQHPLIAIQERALLPVATMLATNLKRSTL